jgi:serine/threonine protein kinase
MPERLAYDNAMRFAQACLQITDPEISQGEVETITISTKIGKIVQPWGVEGGFAVVYKFRTRGGKFRALRCFRRDMDPDTQFRYEHIGPYFQAHAAHITAGFKYHPQGILVKEASAPRGRVYPVIEMEWIEGATLLDTVDELCQQRDQAGLRDLCRRWLSLLDTLQQAHIAHGDLAGGNVMVRRDGSLVLIDYDGVYIPDFTRHQLRQLLLGQPDYQHPQMSKRPFSEHTDAFSALVISTILLVLACKPDLWEKYANRSPDKKLLDTNLLLKQLDFQDPARSALFQEIAQCNDQQVRSFLQELKRACLEPVENAHFPFHLAQPGRSALEELAQAIGADESDTSIVNAWTPALDSYPPAQAYSARVALARQRIAALQRWRSALQGRHIASVVADYDPLLDGCKDVTQHERQLLQVARTFMAAETHNDEDKLVAQYEQIQQQKLPLLLSPEQRQRLADLRQQRQGMQFFARAFQQGILDQVATAFHKLSPEQIKRLRPVEQRAGLLATVFLEAYQLNKDPAILAAHRDLQRQHVSLTLSPTQQARVALAQQCEQARKALRQAIEQNRSLRAVARAYQPILEQSTEVTAWMLDQLNAIRKFIRVYDRGDDQKLLEAYRELTNLRIHEIYPLTPAELARLELARQRLAALQRFRQALTAGEPRHVLASYNEQVLEQHLAPDEQEMLALARQFVAHEHDDLRFLEASRALTRSPYGTRFKLTPADTQRLATLALYEQQFAEFARLLAGPDALALVAAYDKLPAAVSANLTQAQREQVSLAYEALTMREQIRQAIAAKDDATIRQVYKPHLWQLFPRILDDKEHNEVEGAYKIPRIKEHFKGLDYRQMLQVASEIQREGGLDGQGPRLRQAMRQVLRELSPGGVHACIQEQSGQEGNLLQVRWDWPEDELIHYAWVFWETNPPRVPNQQRITRENGLRKLPAHVQIVARAGHKRPGLASIHINTQKYIYTKVCIAMYDEWDTETEFETWCFSPAVEFLAQLCQGSTNRGS